MNRPVFLAALMSSFSIAASAQSLDAHEHGHSELSIAVEGSKVVIELEAPGADIVGFEYAPKSDDDKAAVEAAKAKLSKPIELLGIAAAAGCKGVSTEVELEGEGEHNEFHAKYELECSDVKALATMEPVFFKMFPKAGELEVVAVGDNGQMKGELEPGKNVLDLTGIL